jgi:hypothetical protein
VRLSLWGVRGTENWQSGDSDADIRISLGLEIEG